MGEKYPFQAIRNFIADEWDGPPFFANAFQLILTMWGRERERERQVFIGRFIDDGRRTIENDDF